MSSTHATLLALRTAQNTAMADLIKRLVTENQHLADEVFQERRLRGEFVKEATAIHRNGELISAEVESFVKIWWENYRKSPEGLAVDPRLADPEMEWDGLWPFMRSAFIALASNIIA